MHCVKHDITTAPLPKERAISNDQMRNAPVEKRQQGDILAACGVNNTISVE
jgi:hypothetical protein